MCGKENVIKAIAIAIIIPKNRRQYLIVIKIKRNKEYVRNRNNVIEWSRINMNMNMNGAIRKTKTNQQ